jgi:NAD(P)-dependent dehydrogenase (short-subunit alcohol dehydrogenase family)
MAQACARAMRDSGGSMVNIGSVIGSTSAFLPQAAYAASKAAIIGLTRDLAQQWTGRKGIRADALAPGFFESETTAQYPDGYIEQMMFRVPAAARAIRTSWSRRRLPGQRCLFLHNRRVAASRWRAADDIANDYPQHGQTPNHAFPPPTTTPTSSTWRDRRQAEGRGAPSAWLPLRAQGGTVGDHAGLWESKSPIRSA